VPVLHLPILIAALLLPLLNSTTGERLPWNPEHQLRWEHFKGTPDLHSQYAAMTMIDLSISQGSLQRPDAIELVISTELMQEGSWVKPDKKTSVILAHEQGHFDIAEYHARRLRKELMETAPFKGARLSEDVDAIFERIFQEKEAMQRDYDLQTDHSMKLEPQLEWEIKIASLLDSLSSYSDRSVVLGVK
jgi:hypothetical protein